MNLWQHDKSVTMTNLWQYDKSVTTVMNLWQYDKLWQQWQIFDIVMNLWQLDKSVTTWWMCDISESAWEWRIALYKKQSIIIIRKNLWRLDKSVTAGKQVWLSVSLVQMGVVECSGTGLKCPHHWSFGSPVVIFCRLSTSGNCWMHWDRWKCPHVRHNVRVVLIFWLHAIE